jgi:hypothetical protein
LTVSGTSRLLLGDDGALSLRLAAERQVSLWGRRPTAPGGLSSIVYQRAPQARARIKERSCTGSARPARPGWISMWRACQLSPSFAADTATRGQEVRRGWRARRRRWCWTLGLEEWRNPSTGVRPSWSWPLRCWPLCVRGCAGCRQRLPSSQWGACVVAAPAAGRALGAERKARPAVWLRGPGR